MRTYCIAQYSTVPILLFCIVLLHTVLGCAVRYFAILYPTLLYYIFVTLLELLIFICLIAFVIAVAIVVIIILNHIRIHSYYYCYRDYYCIAYVEYCIHTVHNWFGKS